ncbi:hypothetical protein JTE90_010528 [Oedothorax gibbosus]|uniref:Uncharacterized protein n=1 Tax=Oedothorax gibbosus TaxID=931172 RepID=A0AAV6TFR5_9ARAC|nr:hypothetical protein JTE90_010528 [Oedothorax gibbosus]
MCASQWVLKKPGGRNESTGRRRSAAFGIPVPSRAGRTGDPPRSTCEVAEFERTRWDPKDGELCPAGRGQRKLWWRAVAVLTCKSIVRSGSSGVRLIEPSSRVVPSEVSLRIAGAH